MPPSRLPRLRSKRTPRRALAPALLLLCFAFPGFAETLRVEVDRERIAANETLTLRLIVSGRTEGEPDLAPLEKDFEVLNRSQSTKMSIINGVMSHTLELALILAPKRAGAIEIPALRWGAFSSAPTSLEVIADSGQRDGEDLPKPIFVEAHSDLDTPYVQQSFRYRVKVLYRQMPQRALLDEPQVDKALIKRDGEDQTYSEFIDGIRYQVVERRYLVVPQQSGVLTIRGPRLEAVLAAEQRPSGGLRNHLDDLYGAGGLGGLSGLTGRGRRMVERAPDLDIRVRPQPPGAAQPWLPAESVQLTEEWDPASPNFQVGEPVTRTIVLTARGVSSAQLPSLDLPVPDGLRAYPDQPRTEDLPGTDQPVALKTIDQVLLPTQAGSLTLPELRLPWWDTLADEQRYALLPARTIQVAESLTETSSLESSVSGAFAPPLAALVPDGDDKTTGATAQEAASASGRVPSAASAETAAGYWPWITAFMALGWLVTWMRLGLASRTSAARTERKGKATRRSGSTGQGRCDAVALKAAREALGDACGAGDPRAARAALIAWGRARWPDQGPLGLSELARRLPACDQTCAEVLVAIDRAIYADASDSWNGPSAWQVLAPLLTQRARHEQQGGGSAPLPALYPRHPV